MPIFRAKGQRMMSELAEKIEIYRDASFQQEKAALKADKTSPQIMLI